MSYPFEQSSNKWKEYRNLRTNQLDQNFWTKVTKEVKSNTGSIDSTNRTINFPGATLQSSDSLWKKYSDSAASKGLRPNYAQFLESYKLVKDYDNSKIVKLINAANAIGIKDKDIKKSLKSNKDAVDKLQKIMLNADPETQDLLAPYLAKDKTYSDYWKNIGENIMDLPSESPGLTTILGGATGAAGIYGTYRGVKGAYNYMKPGAKPTPTTPKGPSTTNVQGTKILNTKLNSHYHKLHEIYEKRELSKGRKPKNFSKWKKVQNLKNIKANLTSEQIKNMAKDISKPKVTPSFKTKGMNMLKGLGKKVNPITFLRKNPTIAIMLAAQAAMSGSNKE